MVNKDNYYWSAYNFLVKCNNEEFLLFNSITSNLVKLDAQNASQLINHGYQTFDNYKEDAFKLDKEPKLKSLSINDDLFEYLKERKFIIEKSTDELALLKHQYYKERYSTDVPLYVCLGLNKKCNLSCVYCYQEKKSMEISDELLSLVIEALNKESSKGKEIDLHLFGGEPTLSMSKIKKLITSLNEKIRLHMTTNGFEIDFQDMQFLTENRVKDYQITIDGNPVIHNEQRRSANQNSYDNILLNVKKLASLGATIYIRINLTKLNYNKLDVLFKDIAAINYPNISISIHEAINYDKEDDLSIFFKDRNEFANYLLTILKEKPKYLDIPYPKMIYCKMLSYNGRMINCDGELETCSVNSTSLGNFLKTGLDIEKIDTLKKLGHNALENDKCLNCKMFGSCLGGCEMLVNLKKDYCCYPKYILADLLRLKV